MPLHDRVITKGAKNLSVVGAAIQADILKAVRNQPGILKKVRKAKELLKSYRWLLSRILSEIQVAGWVLGADHLISQLPVAVRDELAELVDLEDSFDTRAKPAEKKRTSIAGGNPESVLDVGATEKAKEQLFERNAISKAEFERVKQQAAARSQAIIKDFERDVVERVREAAYDQRDKGHDEDQYANNLGKKLEVSKFGEGESKVAARYAVTTGQSHGQNTVLRHQAVRNIFPYKLYAHIKDDRVRDDHEYLGKHGYNGTGIYRTDDPFWEVWDIPNDFG